MCVWWMLGIRSNHIPDDLRRAEDIVDYGFWVKKRHLAPKVPTDRRLNYSIRGHGNGALSANVPKSA